MAENRPDKQAKPTRMLALGVGVVLIGLIAVLALASPGPDEASTKLLGQRPPAIVGTSLQGETFDLDQHRGSWVAVNFFATWCAGCVNEHDDLIAFDQWAEERGDVELVSIVFNDSSELVEAFFADHGGTWPVLLDDTVPFDYGIIQIPETFLISPAGQVVAHFEQVTTEQLTGAIEELS